MTRRGRRRDLAAGISGRPINKLTAALIATISSYIAAGNYPERAARAAGIWPSTYYRWMALAKRPDATPILRAFRDAVLEADARSEVLTVTRVQTGFSRNPAAGLKFLAHRFPDRWSGAALEERVGAMVPAVDNRRQTVIIVDPAALQGPAQSYLADLRRLRNGHDDDPDPLDGLVEGTDPAATR